MKNKIIALSFLFVSAIFVFSCKTLPSSRRIISRNLCDKGILLPQELTEFFLSQKPDCDVQTVRRLSEFYVEEAKTEGINSDAAFAQMCLETGWLTFGNLVTPEMHNYCGLGAIDKENPGEIFETERLGVRAHIQHLHAYATTEEKKLKNPLIDNRYKWVNPRGKATTIQGLTKTWAMDEKYGEKLEQILQRMEANINNFDY